MKNLLATLSKYEEVQNSGASDEQLMLVLTVLSSCTLNETIIIRVQIELEFFKDIQISTHQIVVQTHDTSL